MKRLLLICMTLVMAIALSMPAWAESSGFADVSDNAWYAADVAYVRDEGVMTGTSTSVFSPDEYMSRAMLATVLYRASGSPEVGGTDAFPDTESDSWYSDAVLWASRIGVIKGYDDGTFGTNDPASREQVATVLWRYAGEPTSEDSEAFADAGSISGFARDAVVWSRANGIFTGTEENRFEPSSAATRAQVAAVIHRYLIKFPSPDQPEDPDGDNEVLVVYFSATGSTERVAHIIADTLDADTFELVPVDPYTSDDLNYGNPNSRVSREHDNPSLRNILLAETKPVNWEAYGTVFIGYPIWWGMAAWPVNGFVAGNDFTGKTVIPFCTSVSSGLGSSDVALKNMAGTGDWVSGRNFYGRESAESIATWVDGLSLR